MELVLPSDLAPFLAYFRAFKKVQDAAFTSYPHQYNRNCSAYIEEVLKTTAALQKFGLNFIPTLHMFLHVPGFCEGVSGPLGPYGDQGIEQVIINTTVSFLKFKWQERMARMGRTIP